jgi:asparagine synthase (glutamine-hydrolysing)
MSVDVLDLAPGPDAGSARRQIGGIVGRDTDELRLVRLARALGHDAAVLAPPRVRLVGEWDACFIGATALTRTRDWEAVLSQGRLAEVEGGFALAWVDDAGALHLARDGVGERSLFYAHIRDGFAFASTARALVASSVVPARLNERPVPAYLAYGYIPGRETLVDGVFELLPGEHVTFVDGRLSAERFWTLPAEDDVPLSEGDYREQLRTRLEVAVTRRLPESGHLAATLSGGIDSSLVVALAREIYHGPMTAYSLSFGPRVPNEIPFAWLVAGHCGVPHRIVELSPRKVMDRFDSTLGALSKPIGEPLSVANALLFETIAPDAGVVLNGEGGDPCFGGPKNVPMLLREIYGPSYSDETAWHRERAYLLAHRKCFDDLERMLAPGLAEILAAEPLERMIAPHLNDPRWPTLVNRLTALNVVMKGGHHILAKVDHLSRPGGALARSPLFDRSIVEAALRMPAQLKLNGAVEKYILKRAVEDLLPREIVDRRKSGMRVPVDAWLHGRRFERFAQERILDGLEPHGLFRRSYLEELVRPRDTAMPRRGAKIWLLLSLEAWLRTVLAPPA